MGVNLIAPALPATAAALNIPKVNLGWLITTFTLPGLLLTPLIGMLADKYGRKQVLAPSLIVFGLAGSGCFLAKSSEMLLLLRMVQGIGGAGLILLGTTLIGDMFHGLDRSVAMGENASILSIATGVSPLAGGLLALISWNYPYLLFIFAIPLAVAVILMDCPTIQNDFSLNRYVADIWFLIKRPRPLALFGAGILTFVSLYGGILTYLGILLNKNFGAGSSMIGLYLSVMSLAAAISSSQAGRLHKRFLKSYLVLAGFTFYAFSLFLIPFAKSLPELFLPVVLFGIGHGINMPSLQTIATELAPDRYRGSLVSLFGLAMRIGQTIGPPILGIMPNLNSVFWITGGIVIILPSFGYIAIRLAHGQDAI